MALCTPFSSGLFFVDKHRKLLLLFRCLCSKGSGDAPSADAGLYNWLRSQGAGIDFYKAKKRIVSSPTPHYIRHPQQTPSLQSHPPVVLVSWPHRTPSNHSFLPWKRFSRNELFMLCVFFCCIPFSHTK